MKKIIAITFMLFLMSFSSKNVLAAEVDENTLNSTETTVEATFDAANSNVTVEIPDERMPKAESNITNSDDPYVKVTFKANYYYDAYVSRFMWSSINEVLVSTKSGYEYRNPKYSASLIDGSRTYEIVLTGTLYNTKDGTSKEYKLCVDFYLNPSTGAISTILW